MSLIGTLKDITIGATAGVLAVTALPIFGGVGTVTALGAGVGSVLGGLAGAIDSSDKD